MLERTQAPDMGGKKRTYAMMQNGAMLAEALDRARDLLGIPIGEMVPPPQVGVAVDPMGTETDPHHGGKI